MGKGPQRVLRVEKGAFTEQKMHGERGGIIPSEGKKGAAIPRGLRM